MECARSLSTRAHSMADDGEEIHGYYRWSDVFFDW
jgi:hypothetical protein